MKKRTKKTISAFTVSLIAGVITNLRLIVKAKNFWIPEILPEYDVFRTLKVAILDTYATCVVLIFLLVGLILLVRKLL